jgi:hypothetical protein
VRTGADQENQYFEGDLMAKPGKFSVYDFEKKGVVSIWVAIVPLSRIPDKYFEEHRGDEDQPFTQFSEDFGIGFFDHDFVDTNLSHGRARPVEELVGQCSFSSSYVEKVTAEANKRGLQKTQFVFLMFDIEYAPKQTKVSRSAYLEFLGSFSYDVNAESAIPYEGE